MEWDNLSQVSGSDFSTSSLSLVDITGLSFAASANSKYEVEAVIAIQSSSAAGVQVSVNFSAAGATGQYLATTEGNAGAGVLTGNSLGTATSTIVIQATTTVTCYLKAIIVTGANSGNITIQGLKVTSGTLTVFIGSIMKIRKIA